MTTITKGQDKDPRDLFEATFPMPAFVIRCGDGYACTEYSAWYANDFKNKWEGWKACRAAMLKAVDHTNLADHSGDTDEKVESVSESRNTPVPQQEAKR